MHRGGIAVGMVVLGSISLTLFLCATATGEDAGEFVRLMNLGKAYLENRESAKAIEALSQAVERDDQSPVAWRNLARAQLLANNAPAALDALARAAGVEPESSATSYLTGLTNLRLSRFDVAATPFETAARLDPHSATVRYQLARAYQTAGRTDKAVEQLKETLRLDPQHGSAHYKLANFARQAGDQAGFQKHNLEFLRLRKLFGDETRTAEMLERCVYTQPESAPLPVSPQEPGIEVRFVAAGEETGDAVAVLEMDDEGRYEFVVVESDRVALMKFAPSGKFEIKPVETSLPAGAKYTSCIVGDFHNDVPAAERYDAKVHAKNDVLLLGPGGVCLLKRTGPLVFANVTEAAGLSGIQARHARWVDYEHDGDLDLLLGGSEGIALWQNNGDARFENVTTRVGITPTGGVSDVAVVDLDSNMAVDLVVARSDQPAWVFENQRAGRFAPMKEPPGPWPAARQILTNDLDNDGQADVLLLSGSQSVVLYGGRADRRRIELRDIEPTAAAWLDYDNDARLDLVVVGRLDRAPPGGGVQVWRNPGAKGDWTNVSETLGLSAMTFAPMREVLAADVDTDGDSDLLLVAEGGGLRWLRNDGGNANRQLKLKLVTVKTNPTGLGTHVELRQGPFWVTRSVDSLPVEIGVEKHSRLDALQTLWTNGVVDNQIDVVPTAKPLTVLEKNVATGSCPFLYAWDGAGFRFVTDILGNSPIGLSLSRDVLLPADPDEIAWIGDSGSFSSRSGRYTLQVTEEFREVLYLDEAKLLAVDHPSDVEVHSTDKIMSPPFPPSDVRALGSRRSLTSAMGDDGRDRTEALREIDGVFAEPGAPLPPPYRGMCHPMTLTLDFAALDAGKPWVLALTGWLQYGDASTNIAMSQNRALTILPPTLSVETSADQWTPLDVVVGMPAGKTKTILCDLAGKLPSNARRLRLTTSFEIRWDRIALFERRPANDRRIHSLSPASAQLIWRGFSEIRSRAPGHPTTPDHARVSDSPPWRTTLQGWCTRYGDVLPLLTSRDDALAILNAGDALTLEFDAASLPPIPDGMRRSLFFYSVGWDKDSDHNVVDGDLVAPLPSGNPSSRTSDDAWQVEYNTRFVPAGRFTPAR